MRLGKRDGSPLQAPTPSKLSKTRMPPQQSLPGQLHTLLDPQPVGVYTRLTALKRDMLLTKDEWDFVDKY